MEKISIVLVIIVLFNFIVCNYISYADTDNSTITYSKEAYDQLTEEGTVDLNGEETDVSISTSATGSASGTMASLVAPPFMIVSAFLSYIATLGGVTGGEGYTTLDSSAYNTGTFTICSLVFGEYLLFNVNIYQTNADLNPDIEPTAVSNIIDSLKESIVGWYTIIRLVAIALLLVLLIFTGVRLATVTLASEKAKYKGIIKAWVTGLAFILLFPYIIVILNSLVESIIDVLWSARCSLENNGYSSFEYELLNILTTGIAQYGGMKALAYAIEYIAFVVIQISFFGKYIWRVFKIFLLIFLAPIIAILDIFSKIKGGSGNLKEWVSQYLMLLLMQPIHAFIYLIFMFTASEIAVSAPLLGIVFLWVLLRAEKIVKTMLNINYGKITSLFSKPKAKLA